MTDLDSIRKDIAEGRGAFDLLQPLDFPVRVWIDTAGDLVAMVGQLQEDLRAMKKQRDDAVNRANQIRPSDWLQQRTHLADERNQLASSLRGMVAHYKRHTDHRCWIVTEAEALLPPDKR